MFRNNLFHLFYHRYRKAVKLINSTEIERHSPGNRQPPVEQRD
ncbi:hypothetical protein DCCM_3674 [Desulfocucumis palustris]|uniref:Uncharacterized protein n=1 Tax=Desulfocucumis palustris TaxID=1898651 RepID=A0A2L2XE96_9FIRM|nr:hypothetical protein DCCM_3674 [Desulfocucumis palustris]